VSRNVWLTAALTAVWAATAAAAPRPPPPPVDSCLVGTWKSSGVSSFVFASHPGDGAGVMLKIDESGQEEINYDGMTPLHVENPALPPDVHFYRGSAGAFFQTPAPGHPKLVNMQYADLINHAAIGGPRAADHPAGKTTGPGALGNDPNGSYVCTKGTLDVRNTVYTFHYARLSSARPVFAAPGVKPSPKPGPQPPANSQFCVQNSGQIADTYPCTGPVKPGGFTFTLRLKRSIPAPLTGVTFLIAKDGRNTVQSATSGVGGTIAGVGVSAGALYTVTAPPSLCVNANTQYEVWVSSGPTGYGNVGNFFPDCR